MSITNHRTSFAVRLMLMLAVVQFVFVAFEAAGLVHGAEESELHHEQLLADGQVDSDESDLTSTSDLPTDVCDHCCHCHGHGTHFSPLPNHDIFFIDPGSAHPFSYARHFQSSCIHSIHRPPIA